MATTPVVDSPPPRPARTPPAKPATKTTRSPAPKPLTRDEVVQCVTALVADGATPTPADVAEWMKVSPARARTLLDKILSTLPETVNT